MAHLAEKWQERVMKELERQERKRRDKGEVPQMTKNMESQTSSQHIGGTTKEVRQVYRSPSQEEKGKEYDRNNMRPDKTSDVELHVAMEKLFRESPAPIIPGNSIPQSSSSSSPDLPLVLY